MIAETMVPIWVRIKDWLIGKKVIKFWNKVLLSPPNFRASLSTNWPDELVHYLCAYSYVLGWGLITSQLLLRDCIARDIINIGFDLKHNFFVCIVWLYAYCDCMQSVIVCIVWLSAHIEDIICWMKDAYLDHTSSK